MAKPRTAARMTAQLASVVAIISAVAALAGPIHAQEPPSFTPLMDLGAGAYQGYPGGLYPNGANQPPDAYLRLGVAHAQDVRALGPDGSPNPNGAIVLLSIGMSNTSQEFSVFKQVADADARKNPRVVIVNGAQGGQDARIISDPNAQFWAVVDQRLTYARVTRAQVQAVWLKEAIARENRAFPADAQGLKQDLVAIVGILTQRFPNLRLIYVSSRTYGGYATTLLNPEPYAYESGFAVKWLVEEYMRRILRADAATQLRRPWLAWGPYLWTDDGRGRSDGFTWEPQDVRPADGTHPSPSGQLKVANLLITFFTTDPTARGWFVRRAASAIAGQ